MWLVQRLVRMFAQNIIFKLRFFTSLRQTAGYIKSVNKTIFSYMFYKQFKFLLLFRYRKSIRKHICDHLRFFGCYHQFSLESFALINDAEYLRLKKSKMPTENEW